MKILLVDDHSIVRHGLRQLLERLPEAVVFEAATIAEAEGQLASQRPDLVVLDVNLHGENGLHFAKRVTSQAGSPRFIAFSMHTEPLYVREAFGAGVVAFVTKTSRPEELLTAVRKAMRGEQYIDSSITARIAESAVAPAFDGLSGRESEILDLIGQGRSMTEIAAILGVAYKTVANTSLRLREKLGAKTSAELVRLAIQNARSKQS